MLLEELDSYLRSLLALDDLEQADNSLNGLQVERRPGEVDRVAVAVDACAETFRRAVEWGADLLLVHHGLFWGSSVAVRGSHYERVKYLLDNALALYAVHLPLDLHPELGNNAQMAERLDLRNVEPFGVYHGVAIGRRGELPEPLAMDQIIDTMRFDRGSCTAVLPFGPQEIRRVGIVSGGAMREFSQAVEQKLDLYVTGDASHTAYHYALEEGVNLLCAGHYQSETLGVTALARRLSRDLGLETRFIDVPTGL